MFTVRSSHGRALHSPLLLVSRRLPFSSTCPGLAVTGSASTRYIDKSFLQPHGPVAEQLAATKIWHSHGQRRRAKPPAESSTAESSTAKSPTARKRSPKALASPTGDKARVNIVNDKLCDDILSYIGPSLKRHRGCDILDIYPGAGLWSSKLHDFLKPRSHVLLEPDAELYRPFLQPLLDRPGTTLVPKSGIIWRELNSVLTPEYLPHQAIPDDPNARNDTLLVTANVAFHPRKRFLNFESIASLILHQFVSAIGNGGLFQRYGLVRMLIWTRADDILSFMPRNIQRRRRQALENDLVCEWIHEVCGAKASGGWYAREDAINDASLLDTIKRMRTAKLEMPAGREPEGFKEALTKSKKGAPVPGKVVPTFKRPYHDVLAGLQAADVEQGGLAEDSTDFKTMTTYQWRANADIKKGERLLSQSQKIDKIIALYKAKKPNAAKIAAARLDWETEVQEMPKSFWDEFVTYRDNIHAFRQKPALLEWDRRAYEPMTVQPEEFFPNIECSLLDIQPRAPHPLMRQSGPGSNRAGDMFDVILASLMHHATQQLGPGLDSLWPGASDYILPRWTSSQDLSSGGFLPGLRHAEPVPRLLNARQWEELLEIWMEWPFRPELHEFVGRTQDDVNEKFDDGPPNDG
ncbi:putative mitochondrial transcription factor 1 [Rosellinia necatrix]|uniref:Mitochondrial transcription factor 1 n=1 Tax=Rosellinia necatrix TaxID=77044 RepID=A0A1W2TQX5_ROSNE|nr:putative mitochondrial transcription factor 1 [Rosellinia necatrix]